jgi:hypothetical protein
MQASSSIAYTRAHHQLQEQQPQQRQRYVDGILLLWTVAGRSVPEQLHIQVSHVPLGQSHVCTRTCAYYVTVTSSNSIEQDRLMQHHGATCLLSANIHRILSCLLNMDYHTQVVPGRHKPEHSFHTILLHSAQSTAPTASGAARHHHHLLGLTQPACWCLLHSQAATCCCCQHC